MHATKDVDGLPSREDGAHGRAPVSLIDGVTYVNNARCPGCQGEIEGDAWVRDFLLRTRFHASCWVARTTGEVRW